MKDISVLDQLIIGRVDPYIYAFSTNTVPNYLKVGDTYRPVAVRLQEWREHFPDLQKEYEHIAKVHEDYYFRDFAVHAFLEKEKKLNRLQKQDMRYGEYYSKEFFNLATASDVEEAIDTIQRDFEEQTGVYQFYCAKTGLPETYKYARTENYEPRPNQNETIKKFKEAIEGGRTNLLMYAVMRFGKSFTSMCCATEMQANTVVIVSAKADVKEEWKRTVESHVRFADYRFLTGEQLLENASVINEELESSRKVVVFLTLQDLQGDEIKEKHREIFGRKIDLLIVDETHFGARSEKYGQVLKEKGRKHNGDKDDFVDTAEAEEQMKFLDARIRLHLSGTPYRILMGSEFSKEDIIAFYQFTDIVNDQENWIKENNSKFEPEEEWENPYYGFPQMIRFAFNPNESSLRRLNELRNEGISYELSALLKPKALIKSEDGSHKQFIYEKEVLDFLSVIDGSKDDNNLLGFLNYQKIKEGNMCRHIVCVLPFCASCDAMESLIRNHADQFRNLNNYVIVNISGVDQPNAYRDPLKIKQKITACEKAGKKTLTLTVNRMLTGSTVEQWDTMFYLKDTSSPQEYDQAVFRLQNQFIKKLEDDLGNVIKFNMKPQTLLVDFLPNRMFRMQEQKSQIYNVNVDEAGNSHLEERIREELRVSPIIVMNNDKMEQVTASDILKEISRYSNSRGVAEETAEIPVDLSLLENKEIRAAIEQENELGSKDGFSTKAYKGVGEGSDLTTPPKEEGDDATTSKDGASQEEDNGPQNGSAQTEETKKDPVKQFRSYYARILFFAFLTRDVVISLKQVISIMDASDNLRIAKNLGLEKRVLELIQNKINLFVLRDLDYKISNLNNLSHDTSIKSTDRASVAISKFGKLGESEVVTPKGICERMVSMIPDEGFLGAIRTGERILDIAGKEGEFPLAIYERLKKLGIEETIIKESIYTIPTSGITYEFTRFVYEVLGLNVNCLADKFTAYKLLEVQGEDGKVDYNKVSSLLTQAKPFDAVGLSDSVSEGDAKMRFGVIVGNPPYNVSDGGARASARPIYNNFVNIAKEMKPRYMTMIMPSRWYSGGKNLDEFRLQMLNDTSIQELHDYLHPEEIFPGTNNRGGICYLLWNSQFNNQLSPVTIVTHEGGENVTVSHRNLRFRNLDIFVRHSKAIDIINKVIPEGTNTLNYYVSAAKAFGFRTFFIDDPRFRKSKKGMAMPVKCYGRSDKIGFVEKNEITSHVEWIDKWKVYVPESNNIGTELSDDNQNAFVGEPNSICTETFLVIGAELDLNETSALNLSNYLRLRFTRFLLSLAKISQHGTAKTYQFIPVQDFSKPWTDAELYKMYELTDDEIAFIEAMIKPMDNGGDNA